MSSKTPSVLWYPGDYLVGVIGMSWEEQGRYTYLLNLQQQRGHLDIDRIMPDCPAIVRDKFVQDDDGLWYNVRMEEEMIKRYKFVESRRNNLKGDKKSQVSHDTERRMENHKGIRMDNDNDNDKDNDKDTDKRKGKRNAAPSDSEVDARLRAMRARRDAVNSKG